MLPDDWIETNIGALANITSGGTPLRSNPEYWNGNIPWVTTSEVGKKYIDSTSEFISAAGLSSSAAKLMPEGTILVAMYGQGKTRGKVSILRAPCSTNQACACILPSERYLAEFLYYNLLFRYEEIRTLSNEGAQKNLSLALIREINISTPPISEQRGIVDILSAWDQAIEKTEKLIANSQAQKKALMQQLLTGKKRLPGFGDDWSNISLKEFGTTYGGLTGKSKRDFGLGSPFVPYRNIFANPCVQFDSLELVKINAGENQNKVQHGDILFTTSSETPEEVGTSSVVLNPPDGVHLNSFCFGFRPKQKDVLDPLFASHFFRGQGARRQITRLSQGSTRYNLSKSELLKIVFTIPRLDEQKAIADVLEIAARMENELRRDLAKLKLGKFALMQQLLTGKRRVPIKGGADG